jgi:hypothetical protein
MIHFMFQLGLLLEQDSRRSKKQLMVSIQEIWGDSKMGHSKLGPKEDESVINLIQAIVGLILLNLACINGCNFHRNDVDSLLIMA